VTLPPIRRQYAGTRYGQIHVRQRAGEEPAIVFLHQTALSSRCYEPLLRQAALPQRLIALDLPGFGLSFRPEGWPSMAQYACWVLEALDALGVCTMHLFGHHTGAALATEIAHLQPDRVRSLMLCGPVCFTREERARFRNDFATALAPADDGSHLLLNWRYTAEHNVGVPPNVIHEQVLDMLAAWRARPQAYVAVADHDFDKVFGALTTPALILTAAGDYFEDHVDRCRALRPGIDVVQVGGGNLATELDPLGVAQRIADFLAAKC
jgi:pimeloyl-ACP methyl ester carboxylesterase